SCASAPMALVNISAEVTTMIETDFVFMVYPQGSEHPEGHPGIDANLRVESELRSPWTGRRPVLLGTNDIAGLDAEHAGGRLRRGGDRGDDHDDGTEPQGRRRPRGESMELRCNDERNGKCDGQAEGQPAGCQRESAG